MKTQMYVPACRFLHSGNPSSWEEKSAGKIPGNVALLGRAEAGDRAVVEGAAMSGGGRRAPLALLFPLTLSRKLQRKPWEERKGNFNGGTV